MTYETKHKLREPITNDSKGQAQNSNSQVLGISILCERSQSKELLYCQDDNVDADTLHTS